MKFNNYKNIFLAGLLTLAACKPEIEVAPATSGSADFSTYIAIGDSQTAGYADGGLYRSGQINSFPNIIAQQMKSAGGGHFSQPLFTEAQANGSGFKKLTGFDSNGSPILTDVPATAVRGVVAVPTSPTTTVNVTTFTKYTGDNNNYGIPGLKLAASTLSVYGNLNGYYERLLPGNTPNNNTSYLDFATAKPYTFFTCWLGNNDALGYATSGGVGDALTDKSTFTAAFTVVIEKLTTGGKKGAVATIPDVSTIPYFTTVTIPAILAAVQKAAPTVTTLYVSARTSSDPAVTTYTTRAATPADLVVLAFPTSKMGVNGYGVSPLNPIENQYILDPNEVSLVRDYVSSYNQTINSVAASKGLAVFDAYTFLNNVKQKGLLIDGVNLSANYISGGIFSLDGVHLTPRGYAIEANEFIKAINSKYGSTIPQVNISNYNGVVFP